MNRFLAATSTAVAVLALAACTSSNSSPGGPTTTVTVTVTATAGASQSGAPATTTHTSTRSQPAAHELGSAKTIKTDDATYKVTVSNLRKAKLSEFASRPKGVEYEVTVVFVGQDGSVDVNPLDFTARDSAGDAFEADLGQVDGQIDTGTVAAGQRLRGVVSFDVPKGKQIGLIIYSGAAGFGDQQTTWRV